MHNNRKKRPAKPCRVLRGQGLLYGKSSFREEPRIALVFLKNPPKNPSPFWGERSEIRRSPYATAQDGSPTLPLEFSRRSGVVMRAGRSRVFFARSSMRSEER